MRHAACLLVLIGFAVSSVPCSADQLTRIWDYRYGGSGEDDLRCVIKVSDGRGLLLGGTSNSGRDGDQTDDGRGGRDYWIVRLSYDGGKMWDRRFGTSSDDYLTSLCPCADGGYLLCGYTAGGFSGDKTEAGRGGYDYWVVKVSFAGVKQWDKRFGGTGDDRLMCAIRDVSDDGFVLAGVSRSGIGGDKTQGNQGDYDYWVVKIDANGIKQWDKVFGGASADVLQTVRQTTPNGFILGGHSLSAAGGDKSHNGRGGWDYWVMKTDANGVRQWDVTVGGAGHDRLRDILLPTTSGYLLVGESSSGAGGDKSEPGLGGTDAWVVKLHPTGPKLWDRTYGSPLDDVPRWAGEASNGWYGVAGWRDSGSPAQAGGRGGKDYWLLEIDTEGEVLAEGVFGGSSDDECLSAALCADVSWDPEDGYFLAGSSGSGQGGDKTQPGRGNKDYWVAKVLRTSGTKQWDRRFGGAQYDDGRCVAAMPDGNYLVAGTSRSDADGDKMIASQGDADYWLVVVTPSGDKVGERVYGGTSADSLTCLQATPDGGWLLGGSSDSGIGGDKTQDSRGQKDYWIVKLNALLDKQWDRRFGGAGADEMYCIKPMANGWLLGGRSMSNAGGDKTENGRGGWDYWVVRVDAGGNKLWDRTFGGSNHDELTAIERVPGPGSGYLLAGYSLSGAGGDKTQDSRGLYDYWVVKIDNDGNKQWDERYGGAGDDLLQAVVRLGLDRFVLCGHSSSAPGGDKAAANYGREDVWTVMIDKAGNILRDVVFGGTNRDAVASARATSDGGLVIAGESSSDAAFTKSEDARGEEEDMWVLKLTPWLTRRWDYRYGGDGPEGASDIVQTPDAGFLVVGSSMSSCCYDKSQEIRGATDYWLVKMRHAYAAPHDFDGDGVSDIGVLRPSTMQWFVHGSSVGQVAPFMFGAPGDIPAPADYTADDVSEVAVFRPSTAWWYIAWPDGTVRSRQQGSPWDVPIPEFGVYDTLLNTYRPSTATWYPATEPPVVFGMPGDIAVPADYDGDGIGDLAVFRPSTATWYGWGSSMGGLSPVVFGGPGDIPVPGDYDGDGKADYAVFRPSTATWYIWGSLAGSFSPAQYGVPGDQPLK